MDQYKRTNQKKKSKKRKEPEKVFQLKNFSFVKGVGLNLYHSEFFSENFVFPTKSEPELIELLNDSNIFLFSHNYSSLQENPFYNYLGQSNLRKITKIKKFQKKKYI